MKNPKDRILKFILNVKASANYGKESCYLQPSQYCICRLPSPTDLFFSPVAIALA